MVRAMEISGSHEMNGGDQNSPLSPANEGSNAGTTDYGKLREERMKENLQRLQQLGIIDLALKLKPKRLSSKSGSKPPSERKQRSTENITPRRSSRLQNVTPVSYVETSKKDDKLSKKGSVLVEEGSKDEVYTEEHEKLLGTCGSSWDLFVDGYDDDGKRIYDPTKGKTCHQCRQKTLGHRTKCSKCDLVQGQFCGDCLYIRYGENVLEANKNPNWLCPVCRGICNCSLCRIKKGWAPTGPLHRKVAKLGYKSVAHYLIQTRRAQTNSQSPDFANRVSAKRSLPFAAADDSYLMSLEGGSNNISDSTEKKELDGLNQCNDTITAFESNGTFKTKRNGTKISALAIKISSNSIAGRLRSRSCRDKELMNVENPSLQNNLPQKHSVEDLHSSDSPDVIRNVKLDYSEEVVVKEESLESMDVENPSLQNNLLEKHSLEDLHSSDGPDVISNAKLDYSEEVVVKEESLEPNNFSESGSKLELSRNQDTDFDEGKCRVLADHRVDNGAWEINEKMANKHRRVL